MSKVTELNEILLRFAGGKLVGSHKTEVTRYYDDETGEEVGDKTSPATSVSLPLAAEVLGQVAGAAVAKTEADAVTIADLTSERDTLTSAKSDLQTQLSEKTSEASTLASERDSLQAQLETVTADRDAKSAEIDELLAEKLSLSKDLQAANVEIVRLTALVPVPPEPNWITPQEFLGRLQTAAPGIIKRIWISESEIAAEAAVMLFTWSGLIEITRGKLLEQMLQSLKAIDLITEEEIARLFGEV